MEAECEDSNGLGEINIGNSITTEINDKLVQKSEENQIPAYIDDGNKEETGDAEKTHIEPTGCLQSESYKIESVPEVSRNTDQVYENGKRKIKEEKPPTKIVVRRLPPLMTKEIFLEQVSPLPPYDYMYFVTGDPSYGIYSFSRAYLNFINQEDVFTFTRTFDNYVFIDAKGQEYPAVVEFSPFQRVPKQRSKKKDTLTGTIESDPLYISFKENLLAEALENSKPGAKTMKQHYFETEISTAEEINTTPLLEFLKQRRAEKARIRDERREEKKRKEAERKLKQKAKEKKIDGDEEETKDVKVLQSKDRRERDGKDKDNKTIKKKEEKDKQLKENRTREFKNRSGKSYQEERIRQAERREERKKESSSISSDRKSEPQSQGGKEHDERTETIDTPPVQEEKSRSFIEKKRTYENKKKTDLDDWKGDDGDKRIKTDRNRGERRQRERERKRREEFASRKGFDKKSSDIEKKKSKAFKSSPNEYNVDAKENVMEIEKNVQKIDSIEPRAEVPTDQCDSIGTVNEKAKENISKINEVISEDKNNSAVTQRRKSLESGEITPDRRENDGSDFSSKRRNSLESVNAAKTKFMLESSNKSETSNTKHLEEARIKSENYENSKVLHDDFTKKSKINSNPDKVKEEQIKSQEGGQCEHAKDSAKNDNGNKSNDIKTNSESSNNADSSSRSKDPRSDRRIRNKDRPSLQIYRPGMGKFSKQRLEKEKVLGSSTEVDSPSHSPSPSPKVKFPS